MKLRRQYRIVHDNYSGYEAQYKLWWFPFWLQCSRYGNGIGINTSSTLQQAKDLAFNHATRRHLARVAEYIGEIKERK